MNYTTLIHTSTVSKEVPAQTNCSSAVWMNAVQWKQHPDLSLTGRWPLLLQTSPYSSRTIRKYYLGSKIIFVRAHTAVQLLRGSCHQNNRKDLLEVSNIFPGFMERFLLKRNTRFTLYCRLISHSCESTNILSWQLSHLRLEAPAL